MTDRRLPKDIAETLAFWERHKHRWWRLHYMLGAAGLFCTITVATRVPLERTFPIMGPLFDVLAWLSAVAVGLITFLTPSRRGRGYVEAARILSDARNRYLNDPDYHLEQLLNAVQRGEDMISKADPL